jgi:2-phospho-L-lactate guanylyltransferase
VAALVEASSSGSIVIGTDRVGRGTNALLLSPPTVIEPKFGENSFDEHQQLASAAHLATVVVKRATVALDLDTPADVALLLATDRDSRAAHLLREIGIERRLADADLRQARSATI